ncbi:MAG: hypothetical protein IPN90_14010 [Elusimicrobia bacterium]|nr:hypothetical protein [Elusimicrobiota bacterium]
MSRLHVIGAGSLLEFELARTGLPVGRVEILHLQPLSFLEFLSALGETSFMDAVATHPFDQPLNSALHEKGLIWSLLIPRWADCLKW